MGIFLVKVLCRYDLQFLKYTNVKLKHSRFRENVTFDPPKLGKKNTIQNKDQKSTTNREYLLVESNPLFFFSLSSTTFSFETSGGSYPPPPARPRYEIAVHERGLIFFRNFFLRPRDRMAPL